MIELVDVYDAFFAVFIFINPIIMAPILLTKWN
jgi:hypothetical protein